MKKPKISVVIACYIMNDHQEALTAECLRSLKKYASDAEIILVDDKSRSKSKEWLDGWDFIKIIRKKKKLYFGPANNVGWKTAKGKFIVFLNNDTELKEDINRLVDQWKHGDGCIGPKVLKAHQVNNQEYIEGWCFCTKKKILEEVGGFDLLFIPYYGEDTDLSFRIVDAGYKLRQVDFRIYHYHSATVSILDSKRIEFNKAVRKLRSKWLNKKIKDRLVSVIIPNYNYARYVGKAIKSVLNQSYKKVEVIVVDDGSTDDSKKVLEKFKKNPRVKVFFRPHKNGNAARNFGTSKARGKYLLFLDADNYLYKNCVRRMYDELAKDDFHSFVYSNLKFRGSKNYVLKPGEYNVDKLQSKNYINTCSLMKREAFEDVGGFDEKILGLQDWDLWLSMADRRHYGCYIPETLFVCLVHEKNLSHFVHEKWPLLVVNIMLKHRLLK